MRWLIGIVLCLMATGVQASGFDTRVLRLQHDGLDREVLLDLPYGAQAAPMLVVLHGGLAGPRVVRRRARVTLQNKGWVVAYPYAVDDWNDGRVDSDGQPYDTADDVGFLRAMVADLAGRGLVDPKRVFFAGPSIGGVMGLRLVCEAPDLVAGAAVAITSFARAYDCPDGPPVPLIYIHGTEDSIMLPEGGRIGGWNPLVRDRGWVDSVAETVAVLAARNGCAGYDTEPLPDVAPEDGSTVERRIYRGCTAPLVHYVVAGAGHTWPGARESRLRRFVGATNQDFSATATVEAFFQAIAGE